MRLASIVTAAAAVVAAPFVAVASGPQMEPEAFVGAVRCAAYDNLPQFEGDNPELGRTRVALSFEARNQSAEIAARARDEAHAIARHGAQASVFELREARVAACATDMTAAMLADAGAGSEV